MIPGASPSATAHTLINDMYNNMYNDIHFYQKVFKFKRPTAAVFKTSLLDKVKQLAVLNTTTVRDLFDSGTSEWMFFNDVLTVIPTITI